MNVTVKQQVFCQRQQCELDGGRETSGICHMLCPAYYTLAVQFRKTIYKVVGTVFYAVVGREVDYTQILRDFVALHKLTCVAVGSAAKQQVDFIERCLACKTQVGLADKSLMNIGNGVARRCLPS